jgi:gamma-glutamyltranspeptidase/glutathione hydrolase
MTNWVNLTFGLSKRQVRRPVCCVLGMVLILAFPACTANRERANLSPAEWAEGELETYAELSRVEGQSQVGFGVNHLATGKAGMVVGVTEALAVHAGLEALKQGGSAADAAMVTALSQVALHAGSVVSYAGIMSVLYYDAATGRVYAMNALYNTPSEEKDPLSIPAMGSGIPSGRTALVPGFMAGVGAVHDRFGVLPFDALFEPAIYFAEQGFHLDALHAAFIESKKAVLSRLPETKQIFVKENGEFYAEGDLFTQPELAETLRAVAAQGVDYMYTGPWGRKFVEAVQGDGGKITLEDMAAYEAIWSEPVHTTYHAYDVYGPGFPDHGGVNAIEAFNLLEAADLGQYGHYSTSSEALFWFMQIARTKRLSYIAPQELATLMPGRDLSLESRLSKETALWLWEQMQHGKFPFTAQPAGNPSNHSSAVVAVDQWGNMASVVHSINTVVWGETGIFVDGVSIPDSASFQQRSVDGAGPGNRLPLGVNPMIILRDGVPVVGSSSIGGGLHEKTIQCLVNVLDYGMDPKGALDAPAFLAQGWTTVHQAQTSPGRSTLDPGAVQAVEQVAEGDFDEDLLEVVRGMGLLVEELSSEDVGMAIGWWVGIVIDPETGGLEGGAPGRSGGYAEGY